MMVRSLRQQTQVFGEENEFGFEHVGFEELVGYMGEEEKQDQQV